MCKGKHNGQYYLPSQIESHDEVGLLKVFSLGTPMKVQDETNKNGK